MSKQVDILDNVLGVTDVVEESIKDVTPPKPVLVPETKMNEQDIDNDYKYQRENFYNLIERGQDAIDGILDLARESENARTYEVAGNLIKQVAEVTEKLGDLQTKMKKLKEVPNSAPQNVTKCSFYWKHKRITRYVKGKKLRCH